MSEQTIAVIGAMEQEIALLRARMEEVQTLSFGSFTACAGRYAGKRMVLALSGIGKVNAAVATAWVVHQFNPDCVINTGSAGGLGKGLKVGDVVIGDKAAHHDVDVTAFGYEWGQVPRLPAVFDADERLVGAAEQAASVFEGGPARPDCQRRPICPQQRACGGNPQPFPRHTGGGNGSGGHCADLYAARRAVCGDSRGFRFGRRESRRQFR